jgi:Cof subfamily protein (haloacid dehalogenase superfamily)
LIRRIFYAEVVPTAAENALVLASGGRYTLDQPESGIQCCDSAIVGTGRRTTDLGWFYMIGLPIAQIHDGSEAPLADRSRISLVVADVDGTLLTDTKILTEAAISAIQALGTAGIRFAITSSRPPRGMRMFVQPLNLNTPLAGFNGGAFASPDLSILEQHILGSTTARTALDLIRRHHLHAWLYSGNDWFVTDAKGPHVAQEIRAVKFEPEVVSGFDDRLCNAAKIVAVSDDYGEVERCAAEAQALLSGLASVSRSQPYYLDITNIQANKGEVISYLASYLRIPAGEIATIGDSQNDIPMFTRSGFSIAMGNASDQVKAQARAVTGPNNSNGFADGVERFILGRSAGKPA